MATRAIRLENTVRKQHRRDLKAYTSYAKKRFYRALVETITPAIENQTSTVSPEYLRKAYYDVYRYVGVDSAEKEFKRLKSMEPAKDGLFEILVNTWGEWMRDYVASTLGQRIQQVTENTMKLINEAMQEGLTAGDTRSQIARRIYQATLGSMGRKRALLIARTEITTATNEGKSKSADDWASVYGDQIYKKWVNTVRKSMRLNHDAEDSQPPIPKADLFEVMTKKGMILMRQPGDPTAPASEVCNCNCTVVYMSKRFAERNYKI